jgi:hypothetical protein
MYIAPLEIWIVSILFVLGSMYIFGKFVGRYLGFTDDKLRDSRPISVLNVASACIKKGLGTFNFGWVLALHEYEGIIVIEKYRICGGGMLIISDRDSIEKSENTTEVKLKSCTLIFSGKTKRFIDAATEKWK